MNAPVPPTKVNPVLLGRASLMSNQRTLQVFGLVSDDDGGLRRYLTEIPGIQQKPVSEALASCERLWRVRTATVETARAVDLPVDPLTRDQITRAAPPNIGLIGRGSFKIRLSVGSSAGLTTIEFDAGQTIDIYGYQVAADVLGPEGAYEVPSRRDQLTQVGPGVVADALVGFSLNAIEESTGENEVFFTQHYQIPPDDPFSIPIPRFARKVKAYIDVPAPSAIWTPTIGDPALVAGAVSVGAVRFDAAVGRATVDETNILPGDASTLVTDVGDVARLATVVWTIKP